MYIKSVFGLCQTFSFYSYYKTVYKNRMSFDQCEGRIDLWGFFFQLQAAVEAEASAIRTYVVA